MIEPASRGRASNLRCQGSGLDRGVEASDVGLMSRVGIDSMLSKCTCVVMRGNYPQGPMTLAKLYIRHFREGADGTPV